VVPGRAELRVSAAGHAGGNAVRRIAIMAGVAGLLTAMFIVGCAEERPPDTTAQDSCAPRPAEAEYLFYADNIAHNDPTPIAMETGGAGAMGLDATLLEEAAAEAGLSDTIAAMLVVRQGKLVFERYFNGGDRAQANNVHSLSKSILSVLTGIAVAEGLFEPDTHIGEVLPDNLTGTNGDLTVRHLLTMSSGLEMTFDRENDHIAGWEAERRSFVQGALELPRAAAPGERFEYLNSLTQILSAVIAESAGVSTCAFAAERLFTPLGIDAEHWHVQPDGYHAGGHSLFLTAREIARFGQLVLDGGAWAGEQLVPANWLTESLQVEWDLGCRPWPTGYGYLWWLHEAAGYQVWSASGAGGQELLIVPDLELILVLTHATDGDPADFEITPALDLLGQYIIPAVSEGAIPAATPECARESRIVAIRPDGSGRQVLLETERAVAPWSWSPDGSRVALHANLTLNNEIFILTTDDSSLQRLTREFTPDLMPAYSPDGARIAFARGEPAQSDLYIMAADGTDVTRLTDYAGYEHSPTWSPDGQSLAFIRGEGSTTAFGASGALWVVAADGTNASLLVDGTLGAPAWSPDGRRIAFEARSDEATTIQLLDLDSGEVADLGLGSMPRWSPDGSRLIFASNGGDGLSLWIMDADGGNAYQLTSGTEKATLPVWSPDGETIVYVSFDGEE